VLTEYWAKRGKIKIAYLDGSGFIPNGQNGLILNWCTGGCWFTPADETHFATKIGGKSKLGPSYFVL
jgi:hypothetical protein